MGRQHLNAITNFNPLHHEGGDLSELDRYSWDDEFQSTPPRGWRRVLVGQLRQDVLISIHSTTRVETNRRIS